MQNRRVQIVDVHRLVNRLEPEIVGRAVDHPALHAAARVPSDGPTRGARTCSPGPGKMCARIPLASFQSNSLIAQGGTAVKLYDSVARILGHKGSEVYSI